MSEKDVLTEPEIITYDREELDVETAFTALPSGPKPPAANP